MKRLFAILSVLILCFSSCAVADDSGVTIDVLSIGKADCIVITIKDTVVMIDTGEKENLDQIASFLQSKGIKRINTLILSHFDKDHIGCAASLIEQFGVDTIYQSAFSSDRPEFNEYHKTFLDEGKRPTVLKSDFSFSVSDCHFKIFVPQKGAYRRKEDNNASLIVSMTYGENRTLFCGDAMDERLEEFMTENRSDFSFVKLPYHGNYMDSLSTFLDSVKPRHCAITCSYKNPSDPRTLELLSNEEIEYLETKNGRIHLSLTLDEYKISQIKK